MKKYLLPLLLILISNQIAAQLIPNGTYTIFSGVHAEALTIETTSPFDAKMAAENPSDNYQQWKLIHQGNDVYKIRNVATNSFLGINDGWCGNFGDVRGGFQENDANVELKIVTTNTYGAFSFQIAFSTCNFGSVNNPVKAFDIQDGSSGGQIQTFEFDASNLNQQFRFKTISPLITAGDYLIFNDINGQTLASPTNVNQDDSGDSTVNNLFAAQLNSDDAFQKFNIVYQYTNTTGEVYKIRNLGTNQYLGLKDNWCGNGAEVIARFQVNDGNTNFNISKNNDSGRFLFKNDFGPNCNEFSPPNLNSYFDLSNGAVDAKIRTFADTGENQQFRLILPSSTFIFKNNAWLPSVPTGNGTENVLIENGTFATSSDVNFNSIVVVSGASVEISPNNVIDVQDFILNRGSFIFKSNASSTAQLANATGRRLFGSFTVERFIPKRTDNVRAFRFLSSPVGNVSIANSWQQNTHITGAVGTVGETSDLGFDETLTGSPSMLFYDYLQETQGSNIS